MFFPFMLSVPTFPRSLPIYGAVRVYEYASDFVLVINNIIILVHIISFTSFVCRIASSI